MSRYPQYLCDFSKKIVLIVLTLAFCVTTQAQECVHEVTLNDRYMGKVACYFSGQASSTDLYTDPYMELGLFAREFAAHTQIDEVNNYVYMRRGRQTVRLQTTSDVAVGVQRTANAIDYNGQGVESALGITSSSGIIYVPLEVLVNLFLGSSSFDSSIGSGRFNVSTFADTFTQVANQSSALSQTQAQVQTQVQTQVQAQPQAQVSSPVTQSITQPAPQGNQLPAQQLAQQVGQAPTTAPVVQVPQVQVPQLQVPQVQVPQVTQPTPQNQQLQQQNTTVAAVQRIAKPRIGQHDTYTRVALDLPVGSGYDILVRANTLIITLPNMEALGFAYAQEDRFISDIGYQLIDNTLALVVTTRYLMSDDGYGYRIGTLPPSATRPQEVLYIDFGEEITGVAPISSPLYAEAAQRHSMLPPMLIQQLQLLLHNGTLVANPIDSSQELVPDALQVNGNGLQANDLQANGVQLGASQVATSVQAGVQTQIQAQAPQGLQAQGLQAQGLQAPQGLVQTQASNPTPNTPAQPVQGAGTSNIFAVPIAQAPVPSPTSTVPTDTVSTNTVPTATADEMQATAVQVLPVASTSQSAPVTAQNNSPVAAQPVIQANQPVSQAPQAPQVSQAPQLPQAAQAESAPQRLSGFSVVIDPGHGGVDPGASGIVIEEEVVLDVSLKLKELLEQYGIEVIMTREKDASLKGSKRADLAARAEQATIERNLFVSIHANAARNRDAHGVETWVFGKPLNESILQNAITENGGGKIGVELTQELQSSFNAALLDIVSEEQLRYSKILAESIQSNMVASTGAKDRGIKENYFYVIRNAQSPAVLVEIGFVNHPEEGELLATEAYRDKLAEGLFDGIMGFFAVGAANTSEGMANQ